MLHKTVRSPQGDETERTDFQHAARAMGLVTGDEVLIEDLLNRFNRADAIEEALRQIDYKLQLHGKSNEQVGLPSARHKHTEYEIMKMAFDRDTQKEFADTHEPMLTSEQRQVYDSVVTFVLQHKPKLYFADAPAGTGKNFCERVVAARIRGEGLTIICVANTGIAALQLPGGWTAHSMFKLPLN